MYFFYSALLTVAAIVGSPYFLIKGLRERKYLRNFRQRLGALPDFRLSERPVWIHAVSVGEVLAARPLLSAIRSARGNFPVVVSTVTLTGQSLAEKELANADRIIYFPFDWRFCVRRFLDRIRPRLVILLETELWPNFLHECCRRMIPVSLANGRISDRSFGRYRRLRFLTRTMLRQLQVIGAQTEEDKRRFVALGGEAQRVRVTGNLKFDFPTPEIDPDSELLRQLRDYLHLQLGTPVIVMGSTMKGEEPFLLTAYRVVRRHIPQARLIIAPRHPERFDEVNAFVAALGLPFRRRTDLGPAVGETGDVLLLDTIGELRAVYSLASVAVIGGSFLPYGGHNLLEPAALGKAIVFGQEMTNFREMAHVFLREQAARQCTLETLPETLCELLQDADARQLLGHKALRTVRQNQGATESTMASLRPFIDA